MTRRSETRQPPQGTGIGRRLTRTCTIRCSRAGPGKCHCVPIAGRLITRGRHAQKRDNRPVRKWRRRGKWEQGRRRHQQEEQGGWQVPREAPAERAGHSMWGIAHMV